MVCVRVVLVVLLAGPAFAGDGRIEINQARALAGGVTPGDNPGFPVLISQSGSYVLTGPLSGMGVNSSAILVSASYVTLDLGGFEIVGPTVCAGEGGTLSCAPLGTGRGVDASTAGLEAVAVRNGTVRGMGSDGVYVNGSAVLLHELRLVENGGAGGRADGDAVISSCTALRNNGRGFLNGTGIVVVDSVADGNGSDGINTGGGSVVHGSAASNNGGAGIRVFGGSLVAQSVANDNAVELSSGSDTVGYGGNVLQGGPGPTVGGSGAAVPLGPNVCGSDTVCP